jgi:antitoxin component YwqK of YwqJK toxin-antitoxin module
MATVEVSGVLTCRPVKLASVIVIVLALGCSKSERYKSNFESVRIEGDRVLAKSGEPYTGTLVAQGPEITPVARALLGSTFDRIDSTDVTGLLVVVPVDKGVPSGTATLHVDLHAPKLNPEVARRSDEALAVARARSPTIKIAEATFAAGKLHGVATVFAPAGTSGKSAKVGEAQFRDHVLHGVAIEFYPGANQPKRELRFDNGVRAGLQRTFHENGKVETEVTFAANAPHGEMTEHYATGAPRAKGTYEQGKPVGTHEAWYPTGQLRHRVVYAGDDVTRERWYSNGASADAPPNGMIEEFHANGTVHTRTTYENGVQHGPYEALYPNAKKWKAGTYQQGHLHGRYQEWWKNGKPALDATYVAGVLDGDFKRWYANGKDWESARYAKGTRTGPYRKWWKNGKPAHAYTYKDGKLDGDYKQTYDSGAKWVAAKYENGKPQGAIERWYPDGTLGYVMNHKGGRPDGPYKRWWPDGKPRLEAMYVAGQLDGDYKNWLADGTVYEIATYQRGQKIKTTRPPP